MTWTKLIPTNQFRASTGITVRIAPLRSDQKSPRLAIRIPAFGSDSADYGYQFSTLCPQIVGHRFRWSLTIQGVVNSARS